MQAQKHVPSEKLCKFREATIFVVVVVVVVCNSNHKMFNRNVTVKLLCMCYGYMCKISVSCVPFAPHNNNIQPLRGFDN